jgi:probable F420-dependent oxidoreductase
MDVGIFQILPDMTADPRVVAKRAEELGFESYWVPEHPVLPVEYKEKYPGVAPDAPAPDYLWQMPDPFITLAHVAEATGAIKLGTAISLVLEHDPFNLAKEIATLDMFSGGRVLFGIGAGWNQEECEIFGGDFEHRWTQVKEAISIVKKLWTEDVVEHHGKYYDFPALRSYPKPVQKPHPPVILGAIGSNRVFKRVAEWGDGWMPAGYPPEVVAEGISAVRQYAAEIGRDMASIDFTAFGGPGQYPDRDDHEQLAQAGVNRTVVWLDPGDLKSTLTQLEGHARNLLD